MQPTEYVTYDFKNDKYLFPLVTFTDRSLHWKDTLYRGKNLVFMYN